jgi:hypothetical protein
LAFLEGIENAYPGKLIRLAIDESNAYGIRWARDLFQIYGDLVLYSQGHEKFSKQILSNIGLNIEDYEFKLSAFGEGGNVIRSGDILIVSERLIDDDMYQEIKNKGFRIYEMPSYSRDPKIKDRLLGHLDTELNFIAHGNTGTIFASELYFEMFTEELEYLNNELSSECYIVPKTGIYKDPTDNNDYMALNFIELPGKKFILPEKCIELKEKIQDLFGESSILNSKIHFMSYSGGGGGLRCMSNLVSSSLPYKQSY